LENESENAVAFLLDQRELGKYGMFLLQMWQLLELSRFMKIL
jgi:hypothetical protein